jgi:hypothetical protein
MLIFLSTRWVWTRYPTTPSDIVLPNGLNDSLATAHRYQTDENPNTNTTIISKAAPLHNGNYEILITVINTTTPPEGRPASRTISGIIAYANPGEVGVGRGSATDANPKDVNNIGRFRLNGGRTHIQIP